MKYNEVRKMLSAQSLHVMGFEDYEIRYFEYLDMKERNREHWETMLEGNLEGGVA